MMPVLEVKESGIAPPVCSSNKSESSQSVSTKHCKTLKLALPPCTLKSLNKRVTDDALIGAIIAAIGSVSVVSAVTLFSNLDMNPAVQFQTGDSELTVADKQTDCVPEKSVDKRGYESRKTGRNKNWSCFSPGSGEIVPGKHAEHERLPDPRKKKLNYRSRNMKASSFEVDLATQIGTINAPCYHRF
jgi:hypothetical protein